MASLLTADGRVLKRAQPAGANYPAGQVSGWLGGGRPMWSDGSFDTAGFPSSDGSPAGYTMVSYEAIYATQPVVAAAVNKISNQIATLPLNVYRRLPGGERELVDQDHPLSRLLRSPTPRCGTTHLQTWMAKPTLIHGNGLIAKFRRDPKGPPTDLLPVSWPYVEAYAPQGGGIEWWSTFQTGEQRWIKVEDTLHFAWGGPSSEVGVSPLQQLATTIRNEDAAQRYATSGFSRNVTPNLAIQLPADAPYDDETRRLISESIQSRHGGVSLNGGVLVLGGGATVETLSHTAADAELTSQRQLNREEVAMVYDLPGPLIGDLTHGTYSNVTELYRQFYRSTLRPWLALICDTIQAQLIDPEDAWKAEGLFCDFDLSEQLKGDPKEQAETEATKLAAGISTRNESRRQVSLPRVDDPAADELFYASNNETPISQAATAPVVEPDDG